MKDLWKRISNLGVTDEMDFRLAHRVMLSNRFALLIGAIAVFFMVTFLIRGNAGIFPLFGMLLVVACILILNAIEMTEFSRLITSLIPAFGLFILNISQKFGAEHVDVLQYATPRMIIIGSAILPFTMFTAKEKGYVVGAIIFIMILGFGFDYIHEALGVGYASEGIKNEHYGIILEDSVVLAIIILSAAGFMFSMGHRYDEKNQKLLEDAHRQTDHLRKNEEDLRKTLHELEASRQKDEHRSWVARGIAELGGVLQSVDGADHNNATIYERWLSAVIKYMKLNQGGLFISEEDNNGKVLLKLVASYAYERKKYLQKTVPPGEGLLGQAYLEGQRIYLKRIPTDYVHITSGLGDAPPSVLLILPVRTNRTTEAVLELASFKELEEHHFELLTKLAEALAAFIQGHKTNEHTKKLLHQAQTMSEEMRSNEEEMRQNLEELTATQEALARKEKEYQQRIASLEAELATRQENNPPVILNN
jgi:hypothetical protein